MCDNWVSSIGAAVYRQDGQALVQLCGCLNPTDGTWRPIPPFVAAGQAGQVARIAGTALDGKWADFTTEMSGCLGAIHAKDWVGAYRGLAAAYLLLVALLNDVEMSWLLPLLLQSTFDLRVLAELADRGGASSSSGSSSGGQACLRDCSEKFMKSFSVCINDRAAGGMNNPESRQRGVVFVVVSAFRVYFKTRNYQLCKHMVNPVERAVGRAAPLIASPHVLKAHLVPYQYYKGRLRILEDKFPEALTALEYALKHCPKEATSNKRKVLSFLVPLELATGKIPSSQLLHQYNFVEYASLSDAVRRGDLGTFNRELQTFLDLHVKRGTYLVLEAVKSLVYRNLLKCTYRLVNESKQDANTQLKLSQFQTALEMCGEPLGDDEVECVLANLIYNGHVKGYISHKQRVLVLSKTNPFPLDSFQRA